MKRGEVWIVDFGPPSGPEQAGIRPAVVLQDNSFVASLTTVIVIPLTTNLKQLRIPCTVLLNAGEGGLTKDSVALCHYMRSRSKARLREKLGVLPPEPLEEIETQILNLLGI